MPAHLWDRASRLPVVAGGRPRPEVVALAPGVPGVDELFTFMRDAELRFATLRLRIEDRTWTVSGESLAVIEALVRHPGEARVTTTQAGAEARSGYDVWISDGETVRTFASAHGLGTVRPVRRRVAGLDGADLPDSSRLYHPVTTLPMETLPEAFVHPAGLSQNVLATGSCRVAGTDVVAGREAVVLECDHPRGTEVWADRPDHRLTVWVDRETGVVSRLVETMGDAITRDAIAVVLEPDGPLPTNAFDFEFPPGTTTIY